MYREWKGTEFLQKVLSMNLGTTGLRGRPRNRRQDEVRKDGRLAGGIGWRERVHNRVEWKKLLRMARNRHILHMPMNEWDQSAKNSKCISGGGNNRSLEKAAYKNFVIWTLCQKLLMMIDHGGWDGESCSMEPRTLCFIKCCKNLWNWYLSW